MFLLCWADVRVGRLASKCDTLYKVFIIIKVEYGNENQVLFGNTEYLCSLLIQVCNGNGTFVTSLFNFAKILILLNKFLYSDRCYFKNCIIELNVKA